MTEDEMKLTWCPDARAPANTAGSQAMNRTLSGKWQHTLCLGRQCSAWRWDPVPNPAYVEWRLTNSWAGTMLAEEPPPATLKSTTDGYCGRAGRP